MIRLGQVFDKDVQEWNSVLPCIEAVLEYGQDTIEDEGGWDTICFDMITVVDQGLDDGDEYWGFIVRTLTLGLFLTTRVLEGDSGG